jgi:hypothetical protein
MPAFVITEQMAREMPRFEFIAHWLVNVTRKKANRGRLGLWVRRRGGSFEVVSPIGGGTVTYATKDPALLFDYVRRGQLGTNVRDAEEFRTLAYAAQAEREARTKTPRQLESEIARLMEEA